MYQLDSLRIGVLIILLHISMVSIGFKGILSLESESKTVGALAPPMTWLFEMGMSFYGGLAKRNNAGKERSEYFLWAALIPNQRLSGARFRSSLSS
jgi:hypothetical protein